MTFITGWSTSSIANIATISSDKITFHTRCIVYISYESAVITNTNSDRLTLGIRIFDSNGNPNDSNLINAVNSSILTTEYEFIRTIEFEEDQSFKIYANAKNMKITVYNLRMFILKIIE